MRLHHAVAVAVSLLLALAPPALAQQQPNYQPAPQQPNYQPQGNQAPGTGQGQAPATTPGGGGQAPAGGEAPAGGGGAPTAPAGLPRTGFTDGAFLLVLGLTLVLGGIAARRALSPR